MGERKISEWSELPSELEDKLESVKNYSGEYEYGDNYLALLENLRGKNPFSVLVFYERGEVGWEEKKTLNPKMPERMLGWDAQYAQFFYIPEDEQVRLGSYVGSGYRQTQSVYALALASLNREVATDVLVLNQDGKMRHALSSDRLIVQPHEVLQTVDHETKDNVLKNTTSAYRIGDWEKIDYILILEPNKK